MPQNDLALKKKGVESRRTPRRVFTRTIGVLRAGQYQVLQAQQLSEGGMLFTCQQTLSVRDRVVVTVILPDGRGLVVSGEIIYKIDGTMNYGIKFLDLPLNHKRMIRNYVAAKTQEEAELETEDLEFTGTKIH